MKFSEIHLFLYPWKKILFRENYQNFAILFPWKRKSIREKIQKCVRENFWLPVKKFEKVCVKGTFPSVKKVKKAQNWLSRELLIFKGEKNAGGWWWWACIPLIFFRFLKTDLFFVYKLSLATRGNVFFLYTNKAILELVDQNWIQKSTLLANLTPVIWPFWGSKKSFSGLFRSFSRLVWAVFRHCLRLYKAYFWMYSQL